jgi:hypothetical protein
VREGRREHLGQAIDPLFPSSSPFPHALLVLTLLFCRATRPHFPSLAFLPPSLASYLREGGHGCTPGSEGALSRLVVQGAAQDGLPGVLGQTDLQGREKGEGRERRGERRNGWERGVTGLSRAAIFIMENPTQHLNSQLANSGFSLTIFAHEDNHHPNIHSTRPSSSVDPL